VAELDAVSQTLCTQTSLAVFEDILIYSNKQLAHFSKAEGLPRACPKASDPCAIKLGGC